MSTQLRDVFKSKKNYPSEKKTITTWIIDLENNGKNEKKLGNESNSMFTEQSFGQYFSNRMKKTTTIITIVTKLQPYISSRCLYASCTTHKICIYLSEQQKFIFYPSAEHLGSIRIAYTFDTYLNPKCILNMYT